MNNIDYRLTWHRWTTVDENIGAKNTEKLIKQVLNKDIKVQYPPKDSKADITLLNADLSDQEWADLKYFIPIKKIEKVGVYTNIYYEDWVREAVLSRINRTPYERHK